MTAFLQRHSRAIAAILLVAGVVMLVGIISLKRINAATEPPSLAFHVPDMALLLVAVVTIALRPDNRLSWLFGGIFLCFVTVDLSDQWATYSYAVGDSPLPLAPVAAWFGSWLWVPAFGSLGTLLLLWFPDGKPPSRRWRALQTSCLVLLVTLSLLLAFVNDPESSAAYDNPLASPTLTSLVEPAFVVLQIAFPFLVLLCASSLIVRFRRARGIERQQLKVFAFAATMLPLYMIVSTAFEGVISIPPVVEMVPFAALPAAVGVAILRYRLYDIDVVINRTLVYGTLTAVLGAAYVGLVFGLQAVLAPVTEESDLAIAASTLAVAALFRPLRGRIQDFIDRRFYRRKFDAQRTLEDFSTRIRDEVELGALTSRLIAVVAETIQPAHVSLWVKPPRSLVTISER